MPELGPRADGLVEVVVDGRACVYSPATQQIAVLNDTATAIWQLVDGTRTAADVTAAVRSTYGPTPHLSEQVRSTLEHFADLGLVGRTRPALPAPPSIDRGVAGDVSTDGQRLDVLGLRVRLRCDDPTIDDTLRRLLVDLQPGAPGGAPAVDHVTDLVVRVEGHGPWLITSPGLKTTATDRDAALDGALAALNLSAVLLTPTLAVHAAVLTRNGVTIVIPGVSGQGKTTLTAALLQRGWAYVSDEALALRWSDGSVVPYPRPLALSPWAAGQLGVAGVQAGSDVVLAASTLGDVALDAPAPRHVVLLGRDGSRPAHLEQRHRSDGAAELLRRGFTHVADPARALMMLAGLVAAADVWLLRYDSPGPAADALTALDGGT